MRRFETRGDDKLPTSPIQIIMRDAIGPILQLSADPTTAGGELPNHMDMGANGAKLFINMFGTVYKFTGVAV